MKDLEIQIMKIVKEKTRHLNLTQRQIAAELGVSLPTVKRWWSGKGVTLDTLGDLCSLLGLSISQIFLEIENSSGRYTYTLEQEKMLVNNPRSLALFDLLVSGLSAPTIQKKFALKDDELFSILKALDKVDLIELHANNKVKLKNQGEPQWIIGGPLSSKFRKQMIDTFLGAHTKTEMSFYIHDYLPEDVTLLKGKIMELEHLMETCNVRGKHNPERSTSYGSYLSLKEFEWDLRQLLRQKT